MSREEKLLTARKNIILEKQILLIHPTKYSDTEYA